LVIACSANALLVWADVKHVNWFDWVIAVSASLAALGLLTRLLTPATVVSVHAAWLATGMWVANLVEITSGHVSLSGKFRNGGFYLAFALASICLYYAEQVSLRVDRGE
jgi:hypothetical protein